MRSSGLKHVLALDVGERRIGMAFGDTQVKLPVPIETVEAERFNGEYIEAVIKEKDIDIVVVGLPRNQSGEETAQSAWVRNFVASLDISRVPVVFQDESLTSVLAEQRLKASGRPYSKADIDAMAASLILEDYLEGRHGSYAR